MPRAAQRDGDAEGGVTHAPAMPGLVATKDTVGLLLDAVRQARRMASDASASYHGVFLVSRSRPEPRLSLCFDRDFPAPTDLSATICGTAGAEWLAATGRTMTPVWWYCDTGSPHCPAFTVLAIADQAPVLTPGLPGLALPVFADAGASGFVVLAGRDVAVDDALLCDLHLRALPLFAAAARLHRAQSGEVPPMSKRELQCLRLTAEGNTSEAIAAKLGLSVHTANQYLTATTQKLNAVSRTHAVAKALRLGLLD